MYIIWNKKIWGAYASSAGWRPYSCSGVTGCHQDHVHFSFNWAGARAQTSFWSRKVVNVGGSPGNGGTHSGGGSTGNGGSGGTTGNGGGWTGPPSNGGDGWQPPTIPTLPDSALPKTVTVPVDRTVTTSYALAAGHHYLLTVTGSYPLGTVHNWSGDATTLYADAHCMQQPQWHTGEDPTWVSAPDIDADWANQLFELTVNRQSSWAPTVDSGTGCNPSTHTYAMHFTPQSTQRLWLQVIGGDHADGGTLKVTISKDTAN
jgi:hypothetical protein